jgi:hypothetical protein
VTAWAFGQAMRLAAGKTQVKWKAVELLQYQRFEKYLRTI